MRTPSRRTPRPRTRGAEPCLGDGAVKSDWWGLVEVNDPRHHPSRGSAPELHLFLRDRRPPPRSLAIALFNVMLSPPTTPVAVPVLMLPW